MEGKKNGDTEAEQMQCSLMRVSRENKPKGNVWQSPGPQHTVCLDRTNPHWWDSESRGKMPLLRRQMVLWARKKKKLFVSHHFREQDREQILCRIMMSVHCGLQAPVVCGETDRTLEAKVWSCKKRPVVFCWLSVVVPKVKILPKGYFQKHSSTIDYLASRSLIDLAYCYWSKKYVYHQFLRYLLPWSWDEFSQRG